MKIFKRFIVLFFLIIISCPMSIYADLDSGVTVQDDKEDENDRQGAYTQLIIDSMNRYNGMENTYSEGYIPTSTNGKVYIAVPVLCSGTVKDNTLRASINFTETENTPFVYKNYEKNVILQQNYVNDGINFIESYLADFYIELKEDRCNGSYPVVVNIQGTDGNGNEIHQDFTIYVTITDGKPPKDDTDMQGDDEKKNFSPKVVVHSCQYSKPDINAGDEVTADITLINASKTEQVVEMTVKIEAQPEYFTLLEQSDTKYIELIQPGEKVTISYKYKVNAAVPQGQYDLTLAMDYSDSSATQCTSSEKVKIFVLQPINIQFDPVSVPSQVEVADVVEVSVQVMNLGRSKVCNVRAVMEADGLTPYGTIFIGDLEAGTTAAGSTQITVGSMSADGSPYGKTAGTVTYYYTDEAGVEHSEKITFETTISSPFSDESLSQEDKSGQWWIIMLIVITVIIATATVIVVQKIRRRKEHEMLDEIMEA